MVGMEHSAPLVRPGRSGSNLFASGFDATAPRPRAAARRPFSGAAVCPGSIRVACSTRAGRLERRPLCCLNPEPSPLRSLPVSLSTQAPKRSRTTSVRSRRRAAQRSLPAPSPVRPEGDPVSILSALLVLAAALTAPSLAAPPRPPIPAKNILHACRKHTPCRVHADLGSAADRLVTTNSSAAARNEIRARFMARSFCTKT
jgi:hypothetical protein